MIDNAVDLAQEIYKSIAENHLSEQEKTLKKKALSCIEEALSCLRRAEEVRQDGLRPR